MASSSSVAATEKPSFTARTTAALLDRPHPFVVVAIINLLGLLVVFLYTVQSERIDINISEFQERLRVGCPVPPETVLPPDSTFIPYPAAQVYNWMINVHVVAQGKYHPSHIDDVDAEALQWARKHVAESTATVMERVANALEDTTCGEQYRPITRYLIHNDIINYNASVRASSSSSSSSSSSTSNKALSVLLQNAVKAATLHAVPLRQRQRLPSGTGLAPEYLQLSLVVLPTTTTTTASSSNDISCAIAESGHVACAIPLDNQQQQGGNSNSDVEFVAAMTRAVGSAVATLVGVDDMKPASLCQWKAELSREGCAAASLYLHRLQQVIDDNSRITLPEEVRPIWDEFTRIVETSVPSSFSSLTQKQKSEVKTRFIDAYSTLHSLVHHPALIPLESFPIEQLFVMYLPPVLAFVVAGLKCFSTMIKYIKEQKKKKKNEQK